MAKTSFLEPTLSSYATTSFSYTLSTRTYRSRSTTNGRERTRPAECHTRAVRWQQRRRQRQPEMRDVLRQVSSSRSRHRAGFPRSPHLTLRAPDGSQALLLVPFGPESVGHRLSTLDR